MSNKGIKIDKWFDDRGIVKNGSSLSQAIKTLEEVTELFDALNRKDTVDVMDAVGDIYVTLRGVCLTYGVSMDDCIDQAYEEIKDRRGYLTPEGIFVKETV
jgi:NTP pyrophosphatase (non-canonical NTP hydrolase)